MILTIEEIEGILMNLDQCESEGYLNYGDPAYSGMIKLSDWLQMLKNSNSEQE